MFFTLIYMFAGVIGGFCSSAPIGPINLWVADATLKNKDSELPVFLAGVIFCDMTYAGLASWGYYKWLEDGPLYSVFSISGGAFLIVLGILGFLQKNRNSQVKSNTEDEKTNNKIITPNQRNTTKAIGDTSPTARRPKIVFAAQHSAVRLNSR